MIIIKKLFLVFGLIFINFFVIKVYASNSNYVLDTDVVAFIDEYPIRSYNIDNFIYVEAEDLQNYGFDVTKADNSINIVRNTQKDIYFMDIQEFNILKRDDMEIEKLLFEAYPSDTKVYIENELINAFDIDNKAFIQIDELQRFGYFIWDIDRREVKIDMLSFDIDNKLKDIDTSKEPINSYGIVELNKGDDYEPMTFLQKGYFDENGKLIYGIERTDFLWHGSLPFYIEKRGDFKNKAFIYISLFYSNEESRNYINENSYLYLLENSDFEYNYCVSCEFTNSYICRYLRDNGNLFLKQDLTQDEFNKFEFNSDSGEISIHNNFDYKFDKTPCIVTDRVFNATLYGENQEEIYNGEVELKYIIASEMPIYQPKNYSTDDGIIYSPYGFISYIGNVLNGLPSGKGKLYGDRYYTHSYNKANKGIEYNIYSIDGITTQKKVDLHLVYSGNFKNGNYDGNGILYEEGIISSKGTWQNGRRNGTFTDYTYNGGLNAYVAFEGNYKDNKRNGYGISYQPKGFVEYEGIVKECEGKLKDDQWVGAIKKYSIFYIPEQNIHKSYLYFEGSYEFKDDQLEEIGIFYNPDGSIEKQGHFINGELQNN